jgi:hypothetical protein
MKNIYYSSNAIPFLEHCSLCSTTFEFCAKTSVKMALLDLNLDPITAQSFCKVFQSNLHAALYSVQLKIGSLHASKKYMTIYLY